MKTTKMEFDSVVFDLDGVVTNTAKVHARAWKWLFDDYLRLREERDHIPFVPFDPNHDYLAYVDGKPRYEGVRSFLESRDIQLPLGNGTDGPEQETIHGLGTKKDKKFEQLLHREGVEVFQSTIILIKELLKQNIKLAIVSSSKHCKEVLQAANIETLFSVRVDGNLAETLGLKGKPNPDIFLEAATRLGCRPRRSVVVEDAIAGVEAGHAGNFGLVVGIDRTNQREALRQHGADIVVNDLSELSINDINDWFKQHA